MNKYVLKFITQDLPEPVETDIDEKYKVLSKEAHGVFIEKNNAYKSVFIQFGTNGIYVRIRDKLARLLSSADSLSDEDIVENFIDIANYALMGAMINYFNLQKDHTCEHLYEAERNGHKVIMLSCMRCGEKLRLLDPSA